MGLVGSSSSEPEESDIHGSVNATKFSYMEKNQSLFKDVSPSRSREWSWRSLPAWKFCDFVILCEWYRIQKSHSQPAWLAEPCGEDFWKLLIVTVVIVAFVPCHFRGLTKMSKQISETSPSGPVSVNILIDTSDSLIPREIPWFWWLPPCAASSISLSPCWAAIIILPVLSQSLSRWWSSIFPPHSGLRFSPCRIGLFFVVYFH